MNSREKKYLELLTKRFDESSFNEFIKDLLNLSQFDISRDFIEKKDIPKQYQDSIDYYKYIAKYNDGINSIGIIIVKLNNNASTNARTSQRNFIATLMSKYDLDASIVAFYSDSESNWRLSFVKKELNFTEKGFKVELTPAKRYSYLVGENESVHTAKEYLLKLLQIDSRKIKLEDIEQVFDVEKVTKKFFEEYKEKYLKLKEYLDKNDDFKTEAKNYDFNSVEFAKKLMGQIVFLYFLQKKGWLGVQLVPSELSIVEYNELMERVDNVSKNLINQFYIFNENCYVIEKTKLRMSETQEDIINLSNIFSQTNYDMPWGTGRKDFIRAIYNQAIKEHKNFFEDYLEPFFYKGLNEKRDNQYFPLFNCKIPFLNGGLFEPLNNYRWSSAHFNIPNNMFSNDKKDGILDFLDLYNFTIDEEEPLEKDVAVDPEMLGKIFENLLEVDDRKSKGAFYTPREIVYYMCQESIANYLVNKVNVDFKEIKEFIKYGDLITQLDWEEYLNDSNNHVLGDTIYNNILKIDQALIEVKVADPAVGSGAFPLGILNEIVKLRNNLSTYIIIQSNLGIIDMDLIRGTVQGKRELFDMKLQTIENSIYAVDIESSAVDIAKLRLWLSLIVDYPNEEEPRPLPNLDCKIMQGNSLLDEFEGVPLFSERILSNHLKNYKRKESELNYVRDIHIQQSLQFDRNSIDLNLFIDKMMDLQKEYFNTSDNRIKKELKEKISKIQLGMVEESLKGEPEKLVKFLEESKKNQKPWFIWKLEFYDVFKQNGGFDIVIGNPPYVGQKGNSELFVPFKNSHYWNWFYERKQDLYYYFIVRGIMIGNSNSQLSYIIPPYFTTASAGQGLRKFIVKNRNIDKIIKFNGKVFNSASIDSLILFLNGEVNDNKIKFSDISDVKQLDNIQCIESKFSTKDLSNDEWYIFKESNTVEIQQKNTVELGSISTISPGIQTGADHLSESHFNKYNLDRTLFTKGEGIYVLSEKEYLATNFTDEEKKYIKPCYKSSDIEKYWTNTRHKYYLIITNKINNIECLPNIKRHLERYKIVLDGRNRNFALKKAYDNGYWWYLNAFRPNTNFEGEKIVTPYRNEKIKFSYSDYPLYGSIDIFYINIINPNFDTLYILGILNSELMEYWLKNNCKMKGNVIEFYQQPLSKVPIKKADKNIMAKVSSIVKNIIECQKNHIQYKNLQKELDILIYDIYGLTKEEIDFIKENIS